MEGGERRMGREVRELRKSEANLHVGLQDETALRARIGTGKGRRPRSTSIGTGTAARAHTEREGEAGVNEGGDGEGREEGTARRHVGVEGRVQHAWEPVNRQGGRICRAVASCIEVRMVAALRGRCAGGSTCRRHREVSRETQPRGKKRLSGSTNQTVLEDWAMLVCLRTTSVEGAGGWGSMQLKWREQSYTLRWETQALRVTWGLETSRRAVLAIFDGWGSCDIGQFRTQHFGDYRYADRGM
ncbi:hypothetical protein B0H14DRAFT_2563010 [Mycena olivaceomarginata]|nr:hypothetical protein B0H14DRAFT_2563010 [Mycena olivaceomarginata]